MKSKIRNRKGVSGLVIVLGTAFLILIPLGFLGFEMLRYTIVQQELRSVCDAAALAGGVGIATSGGGIVSGTTVTIPVTTGWQQDEEAMAGAYDMFCQNSVTDCQFVSMDVSGGNVNEGDGSSTFQPNHFNIATPHTNVPPLTAQVNFVLLDENNTQTNWNQSYQAALDQPGLTSAISLRVDAYYGYPLPLLGGLGIGPITMNATSTGGLPRLDIILCFDMSGSMDDFTNVTFVNRWWASTTNGGLTTSGPTNDVTSLSLPGGFSGGCMEYDILVGFTASEPTTAWASNPPYWTSGPDTSASGPLYYVLGCNTIPSSYNGSSVNVQPPMNLNQAVLMPFKFCFMAQQRNSQIAQPPHNYSNPNNFYQSEPGSPAQNASFQNNWAVNATSGGFNIASPYQCYTDLIVNLDGDSHWVPAGNGTQASAPAMGGLTYNDLAWACEASRGNMEQGSGSGTALQATVNPGAGNVATDNQYGYIIKDATGLKHYFPGGFSAANVSSAGGYQQQYWSYVQSNTHPLSDAVLAAKAFFKFLNQSVDCHLGLISFSDGIGSSATDTWADSVVSPGGATIANETTGTYPSSSASPPASNNFAGPFKTTTNIAIKQTDPNGEDGIGGSAGVLLPLLQLNGGQAYSPGPPAVSFDNFNNAPSNNTVQAFMNIGVGLVPPAVNTGQNYITACGGTNITDALQEAVNELTPGTGGPGFTRPNATRAIVLFTDGSPDIDGSNTGFSACASDCYGQATNAFNQSISIFSIGLAMDGNMQADQQQLLQGITYAANTGSPATAGKGLSQYQTINSAAQIQSAFEATAKNLVVITK